MRRIKLILAVVAAMATLLAMAAAPAVAHWNDDGDEGCVGVVRDGECIGVESVDGWDGWDHLWGDWEDEWGFAEADLDDCFWWDGDLYCEVDF